MDTMTAEHCECEACRGWEIVCIDKHSELWCSPVEGGWIYKLSYIAWNHTGYTITFVPKGKD